MPVSPILSAVAISCGRPLDQLQAAVLDAQAGQYERLKEFGMLARKAGDQVLLNYRGEPYAVADNPAAVHAGILGQYARFFIL